MNDSPFDAAVAHVVARIESLRRDRELVLIAIDGAGATGKTTFARRICERLGDGQCDLVQIDDFYLPTQQRNARDALTIDSAFDWQRLRDQVLIPLREGQAARYQRYDWPTDSLAEWREVSIDKRVVLIEGVYTMRPELSDLYDFRVWIECPRELSLRRGVARDGEANRDRWLHEWMPAEDRYVQMTNPLKRADLILDSSSWIDAG